MSNKKTIKKSKWGGSRKNAGRPEGSGEKTKITVSVHEENWNTAVKCWKKRPSWLVDGLISRYVKTGGSILKMEAAI
jgi:hypothetical protein